MKPIIISTFASVAFGLSGFTFGQEPPNPKIDFDGFREASAEVAKLREKRRISEAEFLRLAAEPGTIVLDTRSWEAFEQLHVKGARHLDYSDMSAETLAKVIPEKGTKVLIYCNNNFEEQKVEAGQLFPSKMRRVALNIPTFVTLHAYGYTNVNELAPLLDPKTTKIAFAGTAAAEQKGMKGAEVPNWVVGEMVNVTADGSLAKEAPDESQQHPVGFPAFEQLSIRKDEKNGGWIVSGTVCSTNSGIRYQGVAIYAIYGQWTKLIGMSDMKGEVLLRISSSADKEGKTVTPDFLFVGDHPDAPPLREGTRLRRYPLAPRK
ncbi:rhodanese-like domain-containing protein [Haloferula sp. BvORR071]|uniref:rhodanese-like domain-containing protein n=1 Tax=Haloferula sp. BvORR071 TaxID=1396141 RepID=UPI00094662C6|nr:rhodanese-like domain-containing protein [Haloferula sp. BvORR071]